MTAEQVLAISKVYTDKAVEGAGGTAGKNCQIQSIEAIEGGSRITFAWYDDDDVIKTEYLDVMDGVDGQDGANGQDGADGKDGADGTDGVGISAITFKETDAQGNNVYTVTLSNSATYDFTAPRGPQGATGQTGATGETGATGATGPQGPTGIGLLNYSTSEQSTGIKWIDGKTIYQKTVNFGKGPNNTTKNVNHGISSFSNIIYIECLGKATGYWWMLNYGDVQVYVLTNVISISSPTDQSASDYYVTIWYTK